MKKGRLTKAESEYIIKNMDLLPVNQIAESLDRSEKTVQNCIDKARKDNPEVKAEVDASDFEEDNFGAGGLRSIIELAKSKEGLEAIKEIIKVATGEEISSESESSSEPINKKKRTNLFVDDGLLYKNPKDKTPDYIPTERRTTPKRVSLICDVEAGGCGGKFKVLKSPNLPLPEIYRCDSCLSKITRKRR